MRRLHSFAATAALLAVAAAGTVALQPAAAQAEEAALLEPPRHRQGYYATFGARGAVAFVHEDGDTYGPLAGTAYTLGVGQLLTQHLGLGLAIDFGGASGDRQDASFGGLALTGQLQLPHDLTLHAAAGLGILVISSPDDLPDESRGAYGASYGLGLSWDWFFTNRRSGGWSLTPSLELRVLPSDLQSYTALLGVAISWWSGLPKNQLELAPNEGY